jgi:hypothetical protein
MRNSLTRQNIEWCEPYDDSPEAIKAAQESLDIHAGLVCVGVCVLDNPKTTHSRPLTERSLPTRSTSDESTPRSKHSLEIHTPTSLRRSGRSSVVPLTCTWSLRAPHGTLGAV